MSAVPPARRPVARVGCEVIFSLASASTISGSRERRVVDVDVDRSRLVVLREVSQ